MEGADRLEALRQCYAEYLDERRMLLQAGGAFQGVSRFFTGPPAGERVMAQRFLRQLEGCVAQLAETGEAELAALAAAFMLLEAEGFDYNSQLMFQAAESYCLPLLAVLAPADARRLLAGYTARYPKRKLLLPRQEQVLAALLRAAE